MSETEVHTYRKKKERPRHIYRTETYIVYLFVGSEIGILMNLTEFSHSCDNFFCFLRSFVVSFFYQLHDILHHQIALLLPLGLGEFCCWLCFGRGLLLGCRHRCRCPLACCWLFFLVVVVLFELFGFVVLCVGLESLQSTDDSAFLGHPESTSPTHAELCVGVGERHCYGEASLVVIS